MDTKPLKNPPWSYYQQNQSFPILITDLNDK